MKQELNIFSSEEKYQQYQREQEAIAKKLDLDKINGDDKQKAGYFLLDKNDVQQISSFLGFYFTELGPDVDDRNEEIGGSAQEYVGRQQGRRKDYEEDELDKLKEDIKKIKAIKGFKEVDKQIIDDLLNSNEFGSTKQDGKSQGLMGHLRNLLDVGTFDEKPEEAKLIDSAISHCKNIIERPSAFQKSMDISWYCIAKDNKNKLTSKGVVVNTNNVFSAKQTDAYRKAYLDFTVSNIRDAVVEKKGGVVAAQGSEDIAFKKDVRQRLVSIIDFPQFPKELEGKDLKKLSSENLHKFDDYKNEYYNALRKLYRINDDLIQKLKSNPNYTVESVLAEIEEDFSKKKNAKEEEDKKIPIYSAVDIAKLKEFIDQKYKKRLKEFKEDFEDEYLEGGLGGLGAGIGVGLLLAPFTFGLSLVAAPALGLVVGDMAQEAYEIRKIRGEKEADKARLDRDPAFVKQMVGEYNKGRGLDFQIVSMQDKNTELTKKNTELTKEAAKKELALKRSEQEKKVADKKAKELEEEVKALKKAARKHGVAKQDDDKQGPVPKKQKNEVAKKETDKSPDDSHRERIVRGRSKSVGSKPDSLGK